MTDQTPTERDDEAASTAPDAEAETSPEHAEDTPEPTEDEAREVEPVETGPFQTEPTPSEPVEDGPTEAGPIQVEPIKAEPIKAEPIGATPVQAEPVQAEPVQVEPIAEAPTTPEPLTAEPITEVPRAVPAPDPAGAQHAAARPYPPAVTRIPTAESMASSPGGGASAPEVTAIAGPPTAPLAPPPPPAPQSSAPQSLGQTPDAAAGPATHPFEPVGGAPAPDVAAAPPVTRRAARRERIEIPELPAAPGAGRHLLGVLVGLLLTPIALALATVGLGGVQVFDATLADPVTYDVTHLTLLGVGAVLIAAVVALGIWSPAVPLTGGLVWGVGLGALYLGWPQGVEDALDSAYSIRPASLDQLVASLNDGTWLLLGVLLVAAGITVAVARRMGRRFGEHRTLAQHARTEAIQAEDARRQAADAEEAALAERARSIT